MSKLSIDWEKVRELVHNDPAIIESSDCNKCNIDLVLAATESIVEELLRDKIC